MIPLVRKPATTAGDGLPVSLQLASVQGQDSETRTSEQQAHMRAHEAESFRLAREALSQRGCMAHALAALATHYAHRAAAVAR